MNLVARNTRIGPALLMLAAVIAAQYIGWTMVGQVLLLSLIPSLLIWSVIHFLNQQDDGLDEVTFRDEAHRDPC